MTHPRRRHHRSHRLRRVVAVVGLLVVLLLVFTGYQAWRAHRALVQAEGNLTTLSHQIAADSPSTAATLRLVQGEARTARGNTRGPVWWLGSKLPVVGDDVDAVRTVADVVDSVSRTALPRLVGAGQTLSPQRLRPAHGRIELGPIRQATPAVIAADLNLHAADDRLAAIDTGRLFGPLRAPIANAQRQLASAVVLSTRADRAVRLLPPMLGADGKRTYLAIFQNNAEVRATGGLVGAFAVVTADHGRIRMGRQGTASDLGPSPGPRALPLTKQELALFTGRLASYPQDTTFTPDFPRTAALLQAIWRKNHGATVDGVISADPVALSYLLRGTGPVKVAAHTTLTADDAVRLLLNGVYRQIDNPKKQNLFFAGAARSVFRALAAGHGDARTTLSGLVQGASERRLLIWSSHPDEERILAGTSLGGALPTQTSSHPQVGVYLNDSGADKMSYFLDYRASVASSACTEEGAQRLTVTMTLKSLLPKSAPTLPVSITGPTDQGIPPDTSQVTVMLYAPTGGSFGASRLEGRPTVSADFVLDGRPVRATTVDVGPGSTVKLTYAVTTGPRQRGRVHLLVTPGVHGSGIGDVGPSVCG